MLVQGHWSSLVVSRNQIYPTYDHKKLRAQRSGLRPSRILALQQPQEFTQNEIVQFKKDEEEEEGSVKSENEKFDVYAISDLHTDKWQNQLWVKKIKAEKYKKDILIVAGDISDEIILIEKTLDLLQRKFSKVAFVPGNHELWLRRMYQKNGEGDKVDDSLKKFFDILEMCKKMGVIVSPTKIRNLWLVPLYAWHHQSFDTEPSSDENKCPRITDYRLCKWPVIDNDVLEHGSVALAKYFDGINSEEDEIKMLLDKDTCDFISFSHFLPSQLLLPERRFLKKPFIPKAVGSLSLGERVKSLNPHIHVFGHTHISWDQTIDGIRFVQCPLGYPEEREFRPWSMSVSTSPHDPIISYNRKLKDFGFAEWLPAKIYTHWPDGGRSKELKKETAVRKPDYPDALRHNGKTEKALPI